MYKLKFAIFLLWSIFYPFVLIFFLITPEPQLHQSEGVGATRFAGVCGLDGHSQAPKDGFMASCEAGGPCPESKAED